VICDGDRFLQLAWQAHELRSRVAERRGYLEIAYTSLRAAWTIRNALEEARGAERIRLLELHTEAEQARVEAAEAHGRSEIMEALAFRDALTGLANRRSLTERLQAEVARARRRGRPLLVAVVDVDSFKNVNDTLGHAAGDDVLVALGERLLQTLRREDVVGRWGGEEFCVLCPDTNAEAGEIVMGRLVAAASASPIATRSGDVQVTVSIGAALLALDDRHFDDLLGRADLALYSAKHAGKNRYQFAQPPVGVSLAPAVA
jgi:diguanylate cyclase